MADFDLAHVAGTGNPAALGARAAQDRAADRHAGEVTARVDLARFIALTPVQVVTDSYGPDVADVARYVAAEPAESAYQRAGDADAREAGAFDASRALGGSTLQVVPDLHRSDRAIGDEKAAANFTHAAERTANSDRGDSAGAENLAGAIVDAALQVAADLDGANLQGEDSAAAPGRSTDERATDGHRADRIVNI